MEEHELVSTWLEIQNSSHTKRAYRRAIEDFQAFVRKPLLMVTALEVSQWAALLAEKLSPASVNARLAAVSSFYEFCQKILTSEVKPLIAYNPVVSVKRPHVDKYADSRALSLDQVKALLAQPDPSTPVGARNLAMLIFALYTGRRSAEILRLRWGDISEDGRWYHWRGKGGKTRRDELVPPVWAAIVAYLERAGRIGKIQADEYVFAPIGGPYDQPLSGTMFNKLLKRYARMAGLPDWIHVHTLRHTAAQLRAMAGDDVVTISQMLAHARIDTTQIYLRRLQGFSDKSWQAVTNLLSQ